MSIAACFALWYVLQYLNTDIHMVCFANSNADIYDNAGIYSFDLYENSG